MKDRDFLFWLAKRLVNVYGEDENIDFVNKLKNVAAAIHEEQETPNMAPSPQMIKIPEFEMNDTHWDKRLVLAIRENMIELRNEALKQAEFSWAIHLSMCIGLLHHMSEAMEK